MARLPAAGIVSLAFNQWLHLGTWFGVLSGVALIATLIRYPEGLAAGGHQLVRRLRRIHLLPRVKPARPRSGPDHYPVSLAAADPAHFVNNDRSALEVKDLNVNYGGVAAVSDVSLRVDAGRVVGLIGPNGAGKTSVIDATTGFARAKGDVFLNGERIDALPAHVRVRKGLARTFQSLELYDDLTVEENVSAAAFSTAREHRHRHVSDALERAGLGTVRDRHAEELSQGERQLVSIAHACVSNPSVLLLDEPAAGLDTVDSQTLGARIRDIASTGTAVLLVDHDIGLVLRVCDYIYVLDFGRLILEGEPPAIRANRGLAEAYLGTLHGVAAAT